MEKSMIRVIHHMARTGGTVICKCLACMQDIVLLSEIHPLGTWQFNPVKQAQQWFQLFSEQELEKYSSQPISFNSSIRLINDKVEQQGKKLVLRDWSHLDFTAVPFLPQPSYRLQLYDSLVQDFDVVRIATTRHPIDQWLSMDRFASIHGRLLLEQYLEDYLRFAQAAKEIGFVRYEDFTRQPDEVLAQITDALQLQYDPDYKSKWMQYSKITGDQKNKWQEIKPRSRPLLEKALLEKFIANKYYWSALKILGYEHYGE